MKKMISIIALCFLTISLFAKSKENTSYVKANGKTYFGAVIRTGLAKTTVIAKDGERIKILNTEIQSVMHNGHLYESMPIVNKKNNAIRMAMMEYITSRDGYRLYRYNCYNKHCNPLETIVVNSDPEDLYFVYKDGRFLLRADESNVESVLPFFGIEIRS